MRITRYKAGKPPKVRFQPGWFFQDGKGQIYCLLLVFRIVTEPNIWWHILEERKSIKNPETALSKLCLSMVKESPDWANRVQYNPFKTSLEALYFLNDYAHGDRIMLNVSELKKLKLISTAELV